jgi:hypothetical protein
LNIDVRQAWKDLHRDVITVNGEVISGAVGGPEDMIGTLVRKILEHVQYMREKYVSSVGPPVSASSSTEDIGKLRKRQATYADLDEGQALSCARDVLLSCNRTQSGGDTYYTIESLLVNKEFAVLTPFACEADPLEIIVDIVESEKRRALANLEEQDCGSECSSLPDGRLEAAIIDRFDVLPRSSDHSRNTDDTTESSAHTPSSDEIEEGNHNPHSYNQHPHVTLYSPGGIHYDSTELPSDIAGATALPSSVLFTREHSRRKKTSGVVSAGSSVASSGGSSDASYGTEAEATLSNPEDL